MNFVSFANLHAVQNSEKVKLYFLLKYDDKILSSLIKNVWCTF